LLGLAVLTWRQCRIWRTPESLWTHALSHGADRGSIPHNGLGVVLSQQGKWEEEAAHFTEAIRLNPGLASAYNNLGLVYSRRGQSEEAVALYRQAIRLTPDDVEAHINLGAALAGQGRFEEAATHYAEAIRLDPDSVEAYNNRAMLLAACPDAKYRDGQRAIESATRACELTGWKLSNCLDTLAAAYAEAGDFDAAVTWQMTAIETQTDERAKDDYRSRLAVYRARTPYRQASPGHSGPE
jgi:tetratricopeptide (TPR) repeat protein